MKRNVLLVAVLVGAAGLLFYLQGTGVLPFGGMANQIEWAYIGAVMVLVAAGLVVFAGRGRKPPAR